MISRLDRLPALGVILAAALLLLPSVWWVETFDELFHEATILGVTPWDQGDWLTQLFVFADGDPERTRLLVETLGFPWWTDPEVKIAFFRPGAALTHALDQLVLPTWLHGAHSVAWYALLCGLVMACFRRFGQSGSLALVVFVVDPGHLFSVRWISARNALLTAIFAVGALLAHHLWRSAGRSGFGALAPVLLALGLACGESMLAVWGYLVAYALWMDPGSVRSRIASLLPAFTVSAVWLIAYEAAGYGVAHSGFYLDPASTPLRALVGAVLRLPVLFAMQWLTLPARLVGEGAGGLVSWIASLGLSALLFFRVIRPMFDDRLVRFWFVGSVLATGLATLSPVQNRNLMLASVGAAWVLAEVFRRWDWKVLTPILAILHLWMPAALLVLAPFGPGPPALERSYTEGERLVFVTAPGYDWVPRQVLRRVLDGDPLADEHHVLAPAKGAVRLTRVDEHTLDVHAADGFLPSEGKGWFGAILRSYRHPLAPGDRIGFGSLTYVVTAVTRRGMPLSVRVSAAEPLDDPVWTWGLPGPDGVQPLRLPEVGETLEIDQPGARW